MTDAALTDVVLCIVALAGGGWAAARPGGARLGGIGLIGVGIAAGFGVACFSGMEVVTLHQTLSRLATVIGMPLVGLAFLGPLVPGRVRPGIIAALMVVGGVLLHVELYRTAIAALGMIVTAVRSGMLARAGTSQALAATAGAIGVIVAGLAISGDGVWVGMSRTGWFHLAMAVSVALLAVGLRALPSDP